MGYITFSYDDGLKDNYEIAIPLHEKYSIPASLAIIAGRAGSPDFWDKYMTPYQIVDTDMRGHEIVSHGVNHKSKYIDLLPDELKYELKYSKSFLDGLISGNIKAINLPFASYNESVLEETFNTYELVRVGGYKFNDINEKTHLIYSHPLSKNSDLIKVKRLIDKAVEKNKWLVIVFHSISDDPENSNLYTNSDVFLESLLAYSKDLMDKGLLKPILFRDVISTTVQSKIEKTLLPFPKEIETIADEEGYLITFYPSKINTNKLLITFGGLPSTKAPKGFGSDFALNNNYHHIFVAQSANSQYQKLSLEEFRKAVLPLCINMDVYTYGSSLGGYCAIYYSGAINAQAIAAAPKNSAHPTLKHNLKEPVEFLHTNMIDIPKSEKPPIIIYDPYQREENNFINNIILPAYPNSSLVKVPYSGHLVLQVMKDHGILKDFINNVVENNNIIEINYDTDNCYIWNFEYARVLVREHKNEEAIAYLEKSLAISNSKMAERLLEKVKGKTKL
ncbi:polysaccharide deacetylase family protein [Psychrobacter alimentarius]|uniref:polysaccharide deacetylase family protein n=1 Tax=Psychrobacter alimentarius TaxID=261164 RepID=UPI00191ABA82|nr:polysaccharide deacetylase family protein [Psychrobacter alimentarius]